MIDSRFGVAARNGRARLLVAGAAAQGLAPDVLLLSRIKHHLRSLVEQLPNCTCLETVTRFHKEPAGKAQLQPLDTVRLGVVYSNGREWFGSPGQRTLAEGDPGAFIAAGMIANGMFGITLHNLFVADFATFISKGEDPIEGRAAVKYDFRLPRTQLGLLFSIPGGIGNVGEEVPFGPTLSRSNFCV